MNQTQRNLVTAEIIFDALEKSQIAHFEAEKQVVIDKIACTIDKAIRAENLSNRGKAFFVDGYQEGLEKSRLRYKDAEKVIIYMRDNNKTIHDISANEISEELEITEEDAIEAILIAKKALEIIIARAEASNDKEYKTTERKTIEKFISVVGYLFTSPEEISRLFEIELQTTQEIYNFFVNSQKNKMPER